MESVVDVEITDDRRLAALRRIIADQAGPDSDVAFSAQLVASELATNALLHGGGAGRVVVTTIDDGVRIDVHDTNPVAPSVAVASAEAMTGRGLALVASLSARWGVERTEDGKVVWAEVTGIDRPSAATADDVLAAWDDPLGEDPDAIHVVLGDVPTSLLVAAKRHVDNLIREFALAASGDRSGTTAPIPPALSSLVDRLSLGFEHARVEIKRQATEAARRGDLHTTLELDLVPGDADAAEAYVQALDEIDAYSRANRLLTLETPPQHRVFRHWYVDEIVKQLRAAGTGDAPPVVRFEDRLLAEVDAAEHARGIADRAARLYTVAFALASATSAEEVAHAVLEQGVDALGASGGGILLGTGADRLVLAGSVGYDTPVVEKLRNERADAELPAAHALRTSEPVWLESVDELAEQFPALTALEPDTVALCAVPLVTGGGVVGALRFSFSDRRLFDDDERTFVLALAAEAGDAVRRVQLLQGEREARRRLEEERSSLLKVAAVGEAMLRGRELDAVLQLATEAATQVCDAAFGAFFYVGGVRHGERVLQAVSGAPREQLERFPMPRETAGVRSGLADGSAVRTDDVTLDERFVHDGRQDSPEGVPLRSCLLVPVVLRTGEVAAILYLGHPEARRFDSDHERVVAGLAGQAAAAIQLLRHGPPESG